MENEINIEIHQKPEYAKFECPFCKEEIKIDYTDFTCMVDEPCDWSGSKIECPECEKELEIDCWEFL